MKISDLITRICQGLSIRLTTFLGHAIRGHISIYCTLSVGIKYNRTVLIGIMESKKAIEYNKMLKQAQKQPGLVEMMKVYGQYGALLAQSRQYLSNLTPAESFSVGTSTEQEI